MNSTAATIDGNLYQLQVLFLAPKVMSLPSTQGFGILLDPTTNLKVGCCCCRPSLHRQCATLSCLPQT